MGRLPQVFRDDAELRCVDADPFPLSPSLWALLTPRVALPRPIPDDDTVVKLAAQHVTDRRGSPAARAALAGPRGDESGGVEVMRDASQATAPRAGLEDP